MNGASIELMSGINSNQSPGIRQATIAMVIDAMATLSGPPPSLPEIRARLLAGKDADLVNDLYLDSLGAMEFCIQLELEAGLVVTPEELVASGSALPLLSLLESRIAQDGADGWEARLDLDGSTAAVTGRM